MSKEEESFRHPPLLTQINVNGDRTTMQMRMTLNRLEPSPIQRRVAGSARGHLRVGHTHS